MKGILTLLAFISLLETAYAQDEGFDAVLVCAEVNGSHILTILRSKEVASEGMVKYGTADMNHVPMIVKEESYDAAIGYTNGGARVIVTTTQFPQLIFAGQGSNGMKWNGKNWMCQSFL